MISKFVEICRSLYLIDLYLVGIDCLEAVYVLRLICVDSHSTAALQLWTQGIVFWILVDRSLLIRDRKSVSSGISMGRILWYLESES
jgi:hypothetical protein